MNTLELRARRGDPNDPPTVDVVIDGRDLLDRVRALEAPQASADGQPELAGSYTGIPAYEWAYLPDEDDEGRVAVLGCTCGVVACWPLLVRITWKAGTVVWSDFQQPNRGWSYERLGPFTFAREQYETAVAAVTAAHR